MSRMILVLAVAILVAPLAARGIVIDNGLAPPNPANVIDATNSVSLAVLYVGDSAAGSPTTVAVVAGGSVSGLIATSGASQVVITGGLIAGKFYARDSSTITIFGNDFSSNGNPIGYGPVPGSGELAGTLASGDTFNVDLCHNGCTTYSVGPSGSTITTVHTGIVTLVPEPGTLTLLGLGLLMLCPRPRLGR